MSSKLDDDSMSEAASAFDIDEVLGEQANKEKEEVWAIVDDENMDNFD
jgi:hypothetical protein